MRNYGGLDIKDPRVRVKLSGYTWQIGDLWWPVSNKADDALCCGHAPCLIVVTPGRDDVLAYHARVKPPRGVLSRQVYLVNYKYMYVKPCVS